MAMMRDYLNEQLKNDFRRIAGNHQFLVGGNYKNPHLGAGLGNLHFLAAAVIGRLVEINA